MTTAFQNILCFYHLFTIDIKNGNSCVQVAEEYIQITEKNLAEEVTTMIVEVPPLKRSTKARMERSLLNRLIKRVNGVEIVATTETYETGTKETM